MDQTDAARREFLVAIKNGLISAPVSLVFNKASGEPKMNEDTVRTMDLPTVLASEHLIAAPCIDTDVPGYLVLRSSVAYQHIFDAPLAFQSDLGVMLAKLESATISVTGAQHVYIARFSEASATVHFHLFPRTAAIGAQFLRENPEVTDGVNGPLLFDWARRKYHVEKPDQLSAHTLAIAEQIRRTCQAKV